MEIELLRSELGVISTIYEGDDDNDSCLPRLSCANPLSLSTGRDPDVIIHVRDSCFHLHKEPLIGTSTYLKRHLSEFPEMTLSPPLNITPLTFSLIMDFCYGNGIVLTPCNLAALRTAAELLGMAEYENGNGNLKQTTEAYFISVVMVNMWYASIVLRSCFPLLPEAETAACLVSRCLEALSLAAEDDLDLMCLDDFKSVAIDYLLMILESTNQRLTGSHDLLYKNVDNYLKENDDRLSEDQKMEICNYVDCRNLSTQSLIHAVKNPRMPLKFILRVLFRQQHNNRRSIISAVDLRIRHGEGPITAVRQASHLGPDITSTTNIRIQMLEKDMMGLQMLLRGPDGLGGGIDRPGRSASFRISSGTNEIERDEIGFISWLSDREKLIKEEGSWRSAEPSDGDRRFGRRLVRGLKNAFCLKRKNRDMPWCRLSC